MIYSKIISLYTTIEDNCNSGMMFLSNNFLIFKKTIEMFRVLIILINLAIYSPLNRPYNLFLIQLPLKF